MSLPDFLVIGAMKCGTTTLYRDLLTNPHVYLPDKELNVFSRPAAAGRSDADAYAGYFRAARAGQFCGDISTEYSMLPDIPDAADRAGRLLAGKAKIVYLVRDPVRRALSHHFHMATWHGAGRMEGDINDSVHRHPGIVAYSRYWMQLQPWRAAFGDDAIRVIVLEEYTRDRAGTMAALYRFLGIPERVEQLETEAVFNASAGKPVLNRFWSAVHDSILYRKLIRPTISPAWKEKMCKILLPKAPPQPDPPNSETIAYVVDQVRDDAERLQRYLGRELPLWDLDGAEQRYADDNLARAA